MRIVFFSKCGDSLGLALRCLSEGNAVWMYGAGKSYANVGAGYIDKCKNLTEIVTVKPDFVVFDSTGFFPDALTLNKYGIKTLFANAMADRIGSNVPFGAEMAHNVGMEVSDKPGPGMRAAVEVWFQGGIPVFPANISLKTTRFLAGNLGVDTPCQTTLLWNCRVKEPRLVQEHKRIWPLLEKIKYTGPWTVNFRINNDKIFFTGFTPHVNFNAIYALAGLFDKKISTFLRELNDSTATDVPVRKQFGYAVNVSVPPYPHQEYRYLLSRTEGMRIQVNTGINDNIWYNDVMARKDNPVVAGTSGMVLTATVSSDSIENCESKINEVIKQVDIENKQYRIDGIRAVKRDYENLKSMGYF